MKIKNNKIIELYIYTGIFVAFLLVNILSYRVFHVMSVVLMLMLVLINLSCLLKRKYIGWNDIPDKPPSLLNFGLPFIVKVLYDIIIRISGLTEHLYVFSSLFSIAMWILTIRGFVVYIIRYNKAYSNAKKTIVLEGHGTLYNKSIAVINIFIMLLIWCVTSGFIDKAATVKSVSRYNKELSSFSKENEQFGFFPKSIPEDAEEIEFCSKGGIWLASPRIYVRFRTSNTYITDIENMYCDMVTKLDCSEVVAEEITRIDGLWVHTFKDYIGKSDCDVYINDNNTRHGYAINRTTNEICFFYDEEN